MRAAAAVSESLCRAQAQCGRTRPPKELQRRRRRPKGCAYARTRAERPVKVRQPLAAAPVFHWQRRASVLPLSNASRTGASTRFTQFFLYHTHTQTQTHRDIHTYSFFTFLKAFLNAFFETRKRVHIRAQNSDSSIAADHTKSGRKITLARPQTNSNNRIIPREPPPPPLSHYRH